MAHIDVKTDKVINSSQDIISIAIRLRELEENAENIKLAGVIRNRIGSTLHKLLENLSYEAAKMDSLGGALEIIANKYRETEKTIIGGMDNKEAFGAVLSAESSESGTDKRNWWNKFWDWVTRKEPDSYDTTNSEQEKAANDTMKKELWGVLQDEKYSQENWDNSSVEERKQILQDYMDEVINIYGLQDVKRNIIWDSNATYNSHTITWGYYTHSTHSVTLNAQALTDSAGTWDSYELLETVSHELRHAYQQEAIDHPTDYMVSKETIDIWKNNFDNYISSGTDYGKYRAQPVEVDARDFQVSRNDKLG